MNNTTDTSKKPGIFNLRGLLFKLVFPVLLGIAVVGIVIYLQQYWQSKKRFVASTRSQLYSAATLVQDQTSIALALGDAPQVRTILQSFVNHGEFIYAAVFDDKNTLFLSAVRPEENFTDSRKGLAVRPCEHSDAWMNGEAHVYTTLNDGAEANDREDLFRQSSVVEVCIPLFVLKQDESFSDIPVLNDPKPIRVSSENGDWVGTLRIGLSTFNELAAREKENRQAIQAIIFLMLFAFFILALIINNTVGRIRAVASCADKVVGGQLDLRVEDDGDDEVSVLARSFNAMMVRLDNARILEKCLQRSQKLASIGNIAAGVAHEFNNVLQIISTHTELAYIDLQDERALQENLDIILDSSDRASKIVSNLLAFSRKKSLQKQQADLSDVANRMIELMLPQFRSCGVTVVKDFGDLPPVFIDEGQFQQVLMNMFTNAQHAMSDGGGTLTVKTNFVPCHLCSELENGVSLLSIKHPEADNGADKDSSADVAPSEGERLITCGGYVELSISDTGTGISPDDKDRIFDPFYSTKGVYGNTPQEKKVDGTGIGLAVSFGIISNHHGQIKLKSKLGEGTTFSIIIPAFSDAGTEEPVSVSEISIFNTPPFAFSAEEQQPVRSRRVLVVDDEKQICSQVASYFSKHGFITRFATSAEDALNILSSGNFPAELVISDILMPGMSGLELVRQIKDKYPQTLIMLLTGRYTEEIAHIAQEAGACYCDAKPVKLEQLYDEATRCLTGSQ